MSYKVEGTEAVKLKFQKLSNYYGKEIYKSIVSGAVLVQNTARKSIQTAQGGGKIYRGEQTVKFKTKSGDDVEFTAYKGKKGHESSKPGNPPKTDTGTLVASIAIDPKKNHVLIGTALKYGAYLEFGSKDGTLAARPWLIPAMEQCRPKIEEGIRLAILSANERGLKANKDYSESIKI